MEKVRIERLTKDRLKDVKKLIRAAFGRKVSMNYLFNKYDTSAMCGVAYVCHIAYVADQVVGFAGVIPMRAEQNGNMLLVGQACDYYTHPDYQKKGILNQLLGKNNALLKELNITTQLVFHSEITHAVSKGKGWRDNACMMRFHLHRKGLPWMWLLHKVPLMNGIRREIIRKALKSVQVVDFMDNPASEKEVIFIPFTREFIEYKNRLGNRIISIEGCQLWLRFTNILQVGAVNGLTEKNKIVVLNELMKLAKRMGINEVVIHEFRDTPAFHLLSKELDPKPSFPVQIVSNDAKMIEYRPNLIELDAFL